MRPSDSSSELPATEVALINKTARIRIKTLIKDAMSSAVIAIWLTVGKLYLKFKYFKREEWQLMTIVWGPERVELNSTKDEQRVLSHGSSNQPMKLSLTWQHKYLGFRMVLICHVLVVKGYLGEAFYIKSEKV